MSRGPHYDPDVAISRIIEELGSFEGWGTAVERLAAVVEARAAVAAGR